MLFTILHVHGSNYSSAMRFDSARSALFSSGRGVESRLSIRKISRLARSRSARSFGSSIDFDFEPGPILRVFFDPPRYLKFPYIIEILFLFVSNDDYFPCNILFKFVMFDTYFARIKC